MANTFADYAINFYLSLKEDSKILQGIEMLTPFNDEVGEIIKKFYKKYYEDKKKRVFIVGINPGRFGAGITGVTFTDPINLELYCGIKNSFVKKNELSSVFIYEMIKSYGGVEKFFSNFYLGAVSPIGFLKNGKNLNYYEVTNTNNLENFIVEKLMEQINVGLIRKICICLGEDKNYKFLKNLNGKHNFFDEIIPLPHPRFIMQYRRKNKDDYINQYLEVLNKCDKLLI